MRIAPAVSLTEEDHAWLLKTCNSTLSSKRLSERCAVVLLAAKGKRNDQIARQLRKLGVRRQLSTNVQPDWQLFSMPRSIRIGHPRGTLFHVMAVGKRRKRIYRDDDDRRFLFSAMGEACERMDWLVQAWVLMGNLYHSLIQTRGSI